ncbi:MAG TPA: hypothetical protein VN083_02575 [Vicinamibacteria bacterium]|jgi:hypothetical protein|nr:hypothetical protein [Vicinamibacteria bacterium]
MTRQNESGAYQGGIGAMLAQSDVCPHCGRVHQARQISLLAPTSGCPNVLLGAFPLLTEDIAEPAARALLAPFGQPEMEPSAVYPGSLPIPARMARRASTLTVPWPMPSETEEFL